MGFIRTSFYLVRIAVSVLVAPAVGFLSAVAHAQVTHYSTLFAWQAAANQSALFGFEGLTTNLATNPSVSPLAVAVSGGSNNGSYFAIDSSLSSGNFALNGTDVLSVGSYSGTGSNFPTATITFGSTVTAFAIEFGFRSGNGALNGAYTATLLNGATIVGTYSSGTVSTDFLGFTSVSSFDRIQLQMTSLSAGGSSIIDNVRLGTVASGATAPEPGTFALLALGLIGSVVLALHYARRTRVTSTSRIHNDSQEHETSVMPFPTKKQGRSR